MLLRLLYSGVFVTAIAIVIVGVGAAANDTASSTPHHIPHHSISRIGIGNGIQQGGYDFGRFFVERGGRQYGQIDLAMTAATTPSTASAAGRFGKRGESSEGRCVWVTEGGSVVAQVGGKRMRLARGGDDIASLML